MKPAQPRKPPIKPSSDGSLSHRRTTPRVVGAQEKSRLKVGIPTLQGTNNADILSPRSLPKLSETSPRTQSRSGPPSVRQRTSGDGSVPPMGSSPTFARPSATARAASVPPSARGTKPKRPARGAALTAREVSFQTGEESAPKPKQYSSRALLEKADDDVGVPPAPTAVPAGPSDRSSGINSQSVTRSSSWGTTASRRAPREPTVRLSDLRSLVGLKAHTAEKPTAKAGEGKKEGGASQSKKQDNEFSANSGTNAAGEGDATADEAAVSETLVVDAASIASLRMPLADAAKKTADPNAKWAVERPTNR